MGRKAVSKSRKSNSPKKLIWAAQVFSFLQQEGISGVTMDQIAAFLGKSKSTLYEYFRSKEEILNAVLLQKLGTINGYTSILSDNELGYKERYKRFMDFMSDAISDISTKFLSELKNDFPEQWQLIEQFLEVMLAHLHEYYQGGINRKEFKNVPIPLLLAQDQHFLFEILTNPEFLEQQKLSVKEIVQHYLSLKLDGLIISN